MNIFGIFRRKPAPVRGAPQDLEQAAVLDRLERLESRVLLTAEAAREAQQAIRRPERV